MKRVPQLDGVRGIAILLVLIHNTDVFPSFHLAALYKYGWMGVDLFFVLSGFLITGILLDSKDSELYFRNFYARRCLRIWPLYYSLLIFMFAIAPRLDPSQAHAIFERSSPWWAYPFFLQNFLVASPEEAAGALGVTWSLAIEEQFYLFWPLIVRTFSSAQIKRIAAGVILVSPPMRYYLALHHFDIYSNLFCRMDGLMAGALLATIVRSEKFDPRKHLKMAATGLFLALALAIVAETHQARWITFSMTSWAAVSLIYLALFSQRKWIQSLFANRFLGCTGTISYGLYLLHKIPVDVTKTMQLKWSPFLWSSLVIATSYLLATISWTVLEKPFLKFKRFFDLKPPPQAVSGSASMQVPT